MLKFILLFAHFQHFNLFRYFFLKIFLGSLEKSCIFAANKNDKDMKTYTVHYENAYTNKLIIVAADNALQAVNDCMIRYTARDLHGNIYIPDNHDFTAELIENVYSKKSGIKQVINL